MATEEDNILPLNNTADYNDESIKHLEDMEHIRLRPGMYIGKKDIDRLNAAMELNRDLSVAYYLKAGVRLIWNRGSEQQAESQPNACSPPHSPLASPNSPNWLYQSTPTALVYSPISTINSPQVPSRASTTKSKTLKRMAYGFQDDRYFTLGPLALYDFKYSYPPHAIL